MSKTGAVLQEIPAMAWVTLGGVVLAAGVLWYLAHKAGQAATAVANAAKPVANALNPASDTNLVQQLGTAVVHIADPKTISQDTGLSTWLVDQFSGNYDPNANP